MGTKRKKEDELEEKLDSVNEELSAVRGDDPIPVDYFDFELHERAQDFKKSGLATYLGKGYGDLEVGLLSFQDARVIVRREKVEANLRREAGLDDGEDLSGEDGIRLSRATVISALLWSEGGIKTSLKLAATADAAGLKTNGQGVLLFKRSDDLEAVRKVFNAMLATSTPMLLRMLRATKALHDLDDTETCRLGEGSTFGRASDLDWQY